MNCRLAGAHRFSAMTNVRCGGDVDNGGFPLGRARYTQDLVLVVSGYFELVQHWKLFCEER